MFHPIQHIYLCQSAVHIQTLNTFNIFLNATQSSSTRNQHLWSATLFQEDKLKPYNLPAERLAVYHRCHGPRAGINSFQHSTRSHTHSMCETQTPKKYLKQSLQTAWHGCKTCCLHTASACNNLVMTVI